jgi:hypothetical protein
MVFAVTAGACYVTRAREQESLNSNDILDGGLPGCSAV